MSRLILSLEGQVLKEVKLDKERLTIGRRPHNDLQIDNLAVSGQHAMITTLGPDSFLEDLDSTNGTAVNGSAIKKHHLLDGDMVEIGKYKLKYVSEASAAHGAAAPNPDATVILKPGAAVTPIGDTVSLGQAAKAPPMPPDASLRVLSGANSGKELPLTKSATTFGKPGTLVVSVMKRPRGYFLAHVEGAVRATVNAQPVGDQPYPLVHKDKIDVAGIQLEMCFKS